MSLPTASSPSPRLGRWLNWLKRRQPAMVALLETPAPPPAVERLVELCHAMLSGAPGAGGTGLPNQVIGAYASLDEVGKRAFFRHLREDFGPDWAVARGAWKAHEDAPTRDHFRLLLQALEPPRQELFRRMNRAPGATAALVAMRSDLLRMAAVEPELLAVDDDLVHLLQSWFIRGFLVMRRIEWSAPAELLERLIRYEAVHRIQGWEDLRRRLLPADRRCYAFFHPAMGDDPVIFVEVALCQDVPSAIGDILREDRQVCPPDAMRAAVFYSISNCHAGLAGISFGNFLIKQVVEDISRELPQIETYATLSPVPGFRKWLGSAVADDPASAEILARLDSDDWIADPQANAALKALILPRAARYFLEAKDKADRPLNAVARFHLGNGARLDRLCWAADRSAHALEDAAGLMVNYRYDRAELDANSERFARDGQVIASKAVEQLRGRRRPPSAATPAPRR